MRRCRVLPYSPRTGCIGTARWKKRAAQKSFSITWEHRAAHLPFSFLYRVLIYPLSLLSFSSSNHSTYCKLFTFAMASTSRLGTSALRSTSIAAKPVVQSAAFNGLRCYSTGKAKVRSTSITVIPRIFILMSLPSIVLEGDFR